MVLCLLFKLERAIDLANTKLCIMYTKDPLIKEHFIALVHLHYGSVKAVDKILRT